jgi:Resolvase, N terminal domain
VSKQEQNEALQRDALKEAGCEKYFNDKMTGSTFERKGLEELLAFMRSGDTVIVWKLDRLGRSLKDLIETLSLLKNRGVDFISLTESIDTTTPGGKLIPQVITSNNYPKMGFCVSFRAKSSSTKCLGNLYPPGKQTAKTRRALRSSSCTIPDAEPKITSNNFHIYTLLSCQPGNMAEGSDRSTKH